MAWVSVSFEASAAVAETVADALIEHGAISVDVTDAAAATPSETPLFREPGEPELALWPVTRVNALFEDDADYERAVTAACAEAGVALQMPIGVEAVSDRDWVRATQDQFGPIQISSRLWVVPSWCEPPGDAKVVLRLDPGLAFGTGSHTTTWQCLTWLDQHLRLGESVLDFGCGSGILAIAAAKLGAARVVGTDIDAKALEASRQNACANAVAVEFVPSDSVPAERFDVIVANILANPLRALAPVLSVLTRAGGAAVLAGILDAQAEAVRAAYSPWFEVVVSSTNEGWTCLAATRK
jgi:ribosomal protein L11 methyltransferase